MMHLLCVWLMHLFSMGTQQFLSIMPPAVPRSGGASRNQPPRLSYVSPMSDMSRFMMTLSLVTHSMSTMTLAIISAYVVLYISRCRRRSTLTTPKCLQRQDTFSSIDYIVQWVNMGDITSVEDICNSVTFKSPTPRDVKSATSPHHASIDRNSSLQNIHVHSRGGRGVNRCTIDVKPRKIYLLPTVSYYVILL